MSIIAEIVRARRARIEREGAALGRTIPTERRTPVVPFGRDPFVICEIKRRSPSRGEISATLDAPVLASLYAENGAKTVSVLTEEDYFGGSLGDLTAVKERLPELCVLRKDFLLTVEDVEISYRAGADAVLLIAGILDPETLAAMYERAVRLGISCLVEVHSPAEVERAAAVRPAFTGINARDLRTFTVDLALPLKLKRAIHWDTQLVFESGMHSMEHAAYAAGNGFAGILVGEAVVRDPNLVRDLVQGLSEPQRDFWTRLYAHAERRRPLVKVCGLTNREDAFVADALGADLLGFIFAPSKRRAEPAMVRRIGETRASKVGVVVLDDSTREIPREVVGLVEDGVLDAIQFHGDESPEECYRLAFPYYKALQLKQPEDSEEIAAYRCPRVLVDAYAENLRGGTGKRVNESIVAAVKRTHALWLAGGIGPANVYETLRVYAPELVDASSALEAGPGKKDSGKLRAFFGEVKRATIDGIPYDR